MAKLLSPKSSDIAATPAIFITTDNRANPNVKEIIKNIDQCWDGLVPPDY